MASIEEMNNIISDLMKNSADLEEKNKELKKQNELLKSQLKEINDKVNSYDKYSEELNKMKEDYRLLSNDLESKNKELEQLNKNNFNINEVEKKYNEVIKEFDEYKENCDPEKIKELGNLIKKMESEKKKNLDKINNYEKELKEINEELSIAIDKNKNNDQRFEQCKLEYENEKKIMLKKISDLEQLNTDYENIQIKKREELNLINEENNNLINTISTMNNKLIDLEKEKQKVKTETFETIKSMQDKIINSEETISPSKIKELFAENSDLLYIKDSSLTYQNLFNYILQNFNYLSKSVFISFDGNNYCVSTLNIFQECLLDIYLLLYIRCSENKNDKEKKLSTEDFTDDILLNISNEFLKYNIFKNKKIEILLDVYNKKIDNISLDNNLKDEIKESLKQKIENHKNNTLNNIKSVVKKCSESIKNGNIEIEGKVIYTFSISHKVYSIIKGYLMINIKFLTPLTIETINNKIKYPNEPINKIQFKGSFNKIGENYIQKLLLSVYIYSPEILCFSFKNCENLSKQILNYIVIMISNLSNLKILDLESNKLNNEQIKILANGLKENKTLTALILNNNKISSDGGFYLADALVENKNITQLYLSKNNITEDGLKSILNVINKNQKIKFLDISYNELEANDFSIISDFLKEKPNMKMLNLSGNELDKNGAINLGNYFSNGKNIDVLNMSDMNIIDEFIPILFKSFNNEELYFDDNNIKEDGFKSLFEMISTNGNLKKLSLKNTGINSTGLTYLNNIIKKLSNIVEIHLENNYFNENACNILFDLCKEKGVKIFVTLDKLNYNDNNLQFDDINNIIFS